MISHNSALFICTSLIVFILVAISVSYYYQPTIEGYYDTPFSLIENDIRDGNPISMSGRKNPYVDINERGQPDSVVYQANGIPLLHEDHPTTPVKDSMFYFQNHSCRPECCTYSPYSCTNGCVCWEAPPQTGVDMNSSISPRS